MEEISGDELTCSATALTKDILVQFDSADGSLRIVQLGKPPRSVTLPALAALRLLVLGVRYKQALIDVIMNELELMDE